MKKFRLIPTTSESKDWELSSYRGEYITQATDENDARNQATQKYAQAARMNLGNIIRHNPWNNPDLVDCIPLIRVMRYKYYSPEQGIFVDTQDEVYATEEKIISINGKALSDSIEVNESRIHEGCYRKSYG